MLTVDEALARVLARVPRLPSEEVPLADCHGRVLARDVVSPRDVPPWDNSAMDGYAVRAADTDDGEVALRLLEVIPAGGVPTETVTEGTASAIMTGAPLPDGADAVVMVERTDGSREGSVRLTGRATPGQHIRPRGGDVSTGERVLRAGARLTPARVGLAASLGFDTLTVSRRPVVAILTTGDEVVAPGAPLGPGQIYSSNDHALAGLVLEAGGVPLRMGNVGDTPGEIADGLTRCAARADVVVTTGGVSVGAYDHVKEAFADVGAALDFWKVAMKPGKPLAFGWVGDVPLFGLPGNPVSCMVNFLQFVRPFLRVAMGDQRPYLPMVDAVAADDIREKPGRVKLVRVTLERGPDGLVMRSAGSQSSGVLKAMADAHGLLVLPADRGGLAAGESGRVQVLDPGAFDGETPGWPG